MRMTLKSSVGIIVNNKDLIKRLSNESKKNLLSEIEKSSDSPSKNYEKVLRNPNFNIFYNAPCLVYIVGSKDILIVLQPF